jgi:ABC-2 type transport system permease protein
VIAMTISLDQSRIWPTSVGWPTTVRRTVRSELLKLRAIRSYAWLLGIATVFIAVLGPIQSAGQILAGSSEPMDPGTEADAVSVALTGATTANLLLGVLGVLLVTGEYTAHAIRTTLTLVPQRRHVVLAKAIALAIATALTSVVAVALAVTVSFIILSQAGPYADLHLGWGSPHVLHLAAAMVWYLVGWALLGLAAGWLTRSKIGGVALLIGIMYILPPLLGLLPKSIGQLLIALMPSSAGGAMMSIESAGGLSSPGAGFLIWTAYLVLFTALSAWVVARRDA